LKRIDKIKEIHDWWSGNFIGSSNAMYEISKVMRSKEVYAEDVKFFSSNGELICTAKSAELLIDEGR